MFLEHQLELYGMLCHGQNEFSINVITNELDYLTWKEAYTCLSDTRLPDRLRAKYCELIISENISLLFDTFVKNRLIRMNWISLMTTLVLKLKSWHNDFRWLSSSLITKININTISLTLTLLGGVAKNVLKMIMNYGNSFLRPEPFMVLWSKWLPNMYFQLCL